MHRSSHTSRLDYSNYTWRRVQIMKFLVMHFSPLSCHLLSLRLRYSQHSVLKRPQSMSLPPLMLETQFHTHTEPQAKL
jgi:hypothetical protein